MISSLIEVKSLLDLVNGKIVSCSQRHVIISKEGKEFKLEFDTHKIIELKKM